MPKFDVNDYVDVAERRNRFHTEYPDGAIVTESIGDPTNFDQCVIRASVFKHKPSPGEYSDVPDATGIAAEERIEGNRNLPNFSSWWENAETSAIGRALANMGYATTGKSNPSRQEMEKVNRYQDNPNAPLADQDQRDQIDTLASALGLDRDALMTAIKAKGIDYTWMTAAQADKIITDMQASIARRKGQQP